MNISFATTAYRESCRENNNGANLIGCISSALACADIHEIVVVNDYPKDEQFLRELLAPHEKVHLFHNATNLGVFLNKLEAISRSTGDWVITCDSDNKHSVSLLKRLVTECHRTAPDTWLCPSFGMPEFDYRHLCGNWGKSAFRHFINLSLATCCLNTGNQTVHRDSFVDVFGAYRNNKTWHLSMPNPLNLSQTALSEESWYLAYNANDSQLLCETWMQAGGTLAVTPGYEYLHHHSSQEDSNFSRAPESKWRLGEAICEYFRRAFSNGA